MKANVHQHCPGVLPEELIWIFLSGLYNDNSFYIFAIGTKDVLNTDSLQLGLCYLHYSKFTFPSHSKFKVVAEEGLVGSRISQSYSYGGGEK